MVVQAYSVGVGYRDYLICATKAVVGGGSIVDSIW